MRNIDTLERFRISFWLATRISIPPCDFYIGAKNTWAFSLSCMMMSREYLKMDHFPENVHRKLPHEAS